MSEMYLYSNEYKYYIVYKTTNLKNNKFYIGVHAQNEDPQTFDGYLGSGDVIKQAIRKYGRSSFQRETLAWYDNYQDAYDHEAKLVTEEFLVENKGLIYNQRPGGSGGFGMSEDHRQTISNLWKGKPKPETQRKKIARFGEQNSMYGKCGEESPQFGLKRSEETRRKLSEKAKQRMSDPEKVKLRKCGKCGEESPQFGLKRSEETRRKLSEKAKQRMSDPEYAERIRENNRNRVAMHKGDVEIKAKQDEVESRLAEGWSFGRPAKSTVNIGQTQKKKKMEECLATFNVQTEEELRELFTELYMTQNLSLEQISLKYNCKQSLCKYIQRLFELAKDRKARSATRKDSKSKK